MGASTKAVSYCCFRTLDSKAPGGGSRPNRRSHCPSSLAAGCSLDSTSTPSGPTSRWSSPPRAAAARPRPTGSRRPSPACVVARRRASSDRRWPVHGCRREETPSTAEGRIAPQSGRSGGCPHVDLFTAARVKRRRVRLGSGAVFLCEETLEGRRRRRKGGGGGGVGGRRESGWSDGVAVVGGGASLGGLAVLLEGLRHGELPHRRVGRSRRRCLRRGRGHIRQSGRSSRSIGTSTCGVYRRQSRGLARRAIRVVVVVRSVCALLRFTRRTILSHPVAFSQSCSLRWFIKTEGSSEVELSPPPAPPASSSSSSSWSSSSLSPGAGHCGPPEGCVRGQLHAFLSNKTIGLIDPGSQSF